MLLAIGMTLVIATGGVDLSVGAVMAISGSIVALSVVKHHWGPAIVVGLTVGAGAILGSFNGMLVAVVEVQPIVATLILMVSGRGIAQLMTDGQIVQFEDPSIKYFGSGFVFALPFPAVVTVLAYVASALLVRRTPIGLFIEASGDNATASRYSGVDVRRVKWFAYAFCGVCAALAGLVLTADTGAGDANTTGLNLELDAILAVVIGGTPLTGGRFNLAGSFIGALIIQALTTTILTKGVRVEFTLVVKAIAVIAVCLLQSEAFRRRVSLRRRSA